MYEIEFARLVEAGSSIATAPVAAPENKKAARQAGAAAAALSAGSWQAHE